MRASLAVAMLALAFAGPAAAQQPAARVPTDLAIRRAAGLPDTSARGQIELLDVGHEPMSTMISIVARRTAGGWTVSYACAGSLQCAPGTDHLARSYALSPAASAQVDQVVGELRTGKEPDGMRPSPQVIGGWLSVSINIDGFRRDYHRVISWGKTLGGLEQLLSPPAA